MAGKNKKNKNKQQQNNAEVKQEEPQNQQVQAPKDQTQNQQKDPEVKQQTTTTLTTEVQVKVEQTVVVEEKKQNLQTPAQNTNQQTPVQRVLEAPQANPDSDQKQQQVQQVETAKVEVEVRQTQQQTNIVEIKTQEQVSGDKYTLTNTEQVLIETKNDQTQSQQKTQTVESQPHIIIPGSAVQGQFEDVHKELKQKQVQKQIEQVQEQKAIVQLQEAAEQQIEQIKAEEVKVEQPVVQTQAEQVKEQRPEQNTVVTKQQTVIESKQININNSSQFQNLQQTVAVKIQENQNEKIEQVTVVKQTVQVVSIQNSVGSQNLVQPIQINQVQVQAPIQIKQVEIIQKIEQTVIQQPVVVLVQQNQNLLSNISSEKVELVKQRVQDAIQIKLQIPNIDNPNSQPLNIDPVTAMTVITTSEEPKPTLLISQKQQANDDSQFIVLQTSLNQNAPFTQPVIQARPVNLVDTNQVPELVNQLKGKDGQPIKVVVGTKQFANFPNQNQASPPIIDENTLQELRKKNQQQQARRKKLQQQEQHQYWTKFYADRRKRQEQEKKRYEQQQKRLKEQEERKRLLQENQIVQLQGKQIQEKLQAVNQVKKEVDGEKPFLLKLGVSVASSLVIGGLAWMGSKDTKLTLLGGLGSLAIAYVAQK